MRKACVIGWPVSHSLSPRLHNYWLKALKIDGEYVALAVPPQELAGTLKSLGEQGFCGASLTIPHKEAAMPILDEVDPTARAIGAVNTVTLAKGRLKGTNTDAYGFIENLKQNATFPGKQKAVILGAGGAARAVAKALLDEGFTRIVIANRTKGKAEKLTRQFGALFKVADWEERHSILENADLLVNTTSLGLKGHASLSIDLSRLPKQAIVNDLVYAPLDTELLAQARTHGNQTVDGLGMLMHQAVPAFEEWFGVRPEVTDALREHLLETL